MCAFTWIFIKNTRDALPVCKKGMPSLLRHAQYSLILGKS